MINTEFDQLLTDPIMTPEVIIDESLEDRARSQTLDNFDRIGLPLRSFVRAIDWCPDVKAYRVWIAANEDFTLGTYLLLYSDGSVVRTTVREDEGDDISVVRES